MNDPISAMNALNYIASIKKLFSDIEKWSKPKVVQPEYDAAEHASYY